LKAEEQKKEEEKQHRKETVTGSPANLGED